MPRYVSGMERNHELESWLRRHGVDTTFRAVSELLPGAAVVVAGRQQRVLYWSPEAERILGYPSADLLGEVCPDGVLCDGDTQRAFGVGVRLTRSDGSFVYVRQYSKLFRDETGAAEGGIHVLALDASGRIAPSPLAAPADATDFHGLVTRDPAMLRVLDLVRNVAETDATVLIRGESGTGKELVARAIHFESRRRDGPFIAVNCAAFTPTLLESELFGHIKGAFTGAVSARKGIFERADGGTLFLDEVAELPLDLQAKLLRVLQERNFIPVGGTEPLSTDVRVIAATHRALREEVKAGRFREDLMYRLRVVPIFLPSLRQRPLDIDLLLKHFIETFNHRGLRIVSGISPEAMRALLDHPWPGNVREVHNVVEYAYAVGRGPMIGIDELPPEFREGEHRLPARAPVSSPSDAERLRAVIEESDGDIDKAALALGVSRTTFWRMRKRAGLL